LCISSTGAASTALELDITPKIGRQLALLRGVPSGWRAICLCAAGLFADTNVGVRLTVNMVISVHPSEVNQIVANRGMIML
jgi:hypothetical protein